MTMMQKSMTMLVLWTFLYGGFWQCKRGGDLPETMVVAVDPTATTPAMQHPWQYLQEKEES